MKRAVGFLSFCAQLFSFLQRSIENKIDQKIFPSRAYARVVCERTFLFLLFIFFFLIRGCGGNFLFSLFFFFFFSSEVFGKNENNFGRNSNNFGRNRDYFGKNENNFGKNENNFGRNSNNFGRNSNNFGRNSNNFGRNRDYFGSYCYKWGRNFGLKLCRAVKPGFSKNRKK